MPSHYDHAKNVAGKAMGGYQTGRAIGGAAVRGAQAFDRHMDAANMSAIRGRPMAHDTLVQRYTAGRQAENMRQHFNRTMPTDAPGPRTSAFYAYRYRRPGMAPAGGESVGTPEQMGLLGQLRRQQALIHAVRTGPPRVGMYRDADPATPYVSRAFQRWY